jgi:acyl carrier protein
MSDFYKGMADIFEVDINDITSEFELNSGEAPWDSLAIVSTIALIDDLYGVTPDGKSLASCVSVLDIEKLIQLLKS